MKNFWTTLPRPFFVQAPLEDVTDAAFRALIAEIGKVPRPDWRGGPDVMYTEFTSADGLLLASAEGKKKLLKKFLFGEHERPIVAQLFTSVPEHMEKAAEIVRDMGFDGFDINMGCPDRSVEKSGCGAALIKNPTLARQLIRAAQKSGLPISIKTRIGYKKDELETWLPELLAENPSTIIIHARTREEMSDVPARWDRIARAVQIRGSLGSRTLIVGNGDVKDIADARTKVADTKCDGVMIGRAVFGNPWLFADRVDEPTPRERVNTLIRHLELFDELLTGTTSFAVMKKHFKAYISGWDGAKETRMRLMETNSVEEALNILAAN